MWLKFCYKNIAKIHNVSFIFQNFDKFQQSKKIDKILKNFQKWKNSFKIKTIINYDT